jgi:hypothetical protein
MLASGGRNGQYQEVEVDGLNEVGYGVMKFFSVQNRSNSGVAWLPWPSRIKSLYLLTPVVTVFGSRSVLTSLIQAHSTQFFNEPGGCGNSA